MKIDQSFINSLRQYGIAINEGIHAVPTYSALSDRPSAATFGVGICQIGDGVYSSDGIRWGKVNKELSAKVAAAIRPLKNSDGHLKWCVVGDNTGASTNTWSYPFASALANNYPAHTHKFRVFNDTTQQYDRPIIVHTGTEGAAHILTKGASGGESTAHFLRLADAASNSIVGDIDVRVKLNFNGSMFSATGTLCGKYGAGGSISWRFYIGTDGKPVFEWSEDGTALISSTSTAALTGALLSSDIWLKVTLDVNNGAVGNDVKFYTSVDEQVTWSQLGATVTNAGVTSIFDSNTPVQFIGYSGIDYFELQDHAISFYGLEVYASLDGTSRVIDLDVGDIAVIPDSTSTPTFYDEIGNLWTLNYYAGGEGAFVGAPVFAFYNGCVAAKTISYAYDATRNPKLVPGKPALTIINFSHTDSTDVDYRPNYKTLTDMLLAINPDMSIVATAQNKQVAPAQSINEHALRNRQIVEFAASQDFDLIDIFSSMTDSALFAADGIYPNADGYTFWSEQVKDYFNLS